MLPFIQQRLCLLQKYLCIPSKKCVWNEVCTEMPFETYSLLAWLPHVSIGFKQRTDVLRLAAPDVAMNGPIESEF